MVKLTLFILALALISGQTYAGSFVCPNTYQTIMTGYSLQQVEAACGKPTTIHSKNQIQTKPANYTQWVYTSSSPLSINQYAPQMLITFAEDKVTEISVSNQQHIASFPCYNFGKIQVGSSTSQVQTQCGPPTYVNQIQKAFKTPITVTVLTYNFGSYRPIMIFTFENDKLTNIETGQLAK